MSASRFRKYRLSQIQHQPVGPGKDRNRMDQVQHLAIVQPMLTQCLYMTGVQARRIQRQIDGKAHDGPLAGRGASSGRIGEDLADHVVALGQLFKALCMDRGAIHATIEPRHHGARQLALGAGQAAGGVQR